MAEGGHWRVYGLSFVGEASHAWWKTFVPFGFALIACCLLFFAFGLPNENGQIASLLQDLGADTETAARAGDGIDFLMRISLATLLIVAFLAGLAACTAAYLAHRETSRALVRATERGADTAAVPAPTQVERVTAERFPKIEGFLFVSSLIGGGLSALMVLFSGGIGEVVLTGLLGCAVVGLFLLWYRRIRNVEVPEHYRRRERIAAHWSTADEEAAWQAARTAEEARAEHAGHRWEASRLSSVGVALVRVAGGLVVVAVPLFYLVAFTMYPNARRISQYQWEAGERVDRGPAVESLIEAGLWVFAAMLVLMVLLPALGLLLQTVGRAIDRGRLVRALNGRDSDRPSAPPSDELLRRFAQRQSDPIADVLAAVAGVCAVFGPAALVLSSLGTTGFYENAADIFGPFRGAAVMLSVASVLLLVAALLLNVWRGARDLEFRNMLLARWPTLPEPKKRETAEGEPEAFVPATVGPALDPQAGYR